MNWTHEQAVLLCKRIEEWCPAFGCHVALTGGMLYGEGERKDCDLIFYRIRQNNFDVKGLRRELMVREMLTKDYQNDWVTKLTKVFTGQKIDIMIPNDRFAPKEKQEEDYKP